MNTIPKIASAISLGLVVVPCMLNFTSVVDLDAVKWAALVGTIGWFMATPIWMSRRSPGNSVKVKS